MFRRHEASPSPMRANYDFALRHERAKLYLKIVAQCDGQVARTSQALRDLVSGFSQVAQSYYEVSLCVNNINPSAASILQARRAPAAGDEGHESDDEDRYGDNPTNDYSMVNNTNTNTNGGDCCGGGGGDRMDVLRKGARNEIGYQDGVVSTYGKGLQTAAKVFAAETRALKEGPRFSEYSEGVHTGVLGRLKEVSAAAKAAVTAGDETAALMRKLQKARKLLSLKERKYERLGRPLSESKKYEQQAADMRSAETHYTARLAFFDDKYEHLFQRELYVTGHTLDSFLDVNFTFMAQLMQVVGCLAPSAPETVDRVVVAGGDALGKRMGIAEDERIGGAIRRQRGGGGGGVTPKPKSNASAAAAAAASGGVSHNFTGYFSTRRDDRRPTTTTPGVTPKKAAAAAAATVVVDLDDDYVAPRTARNTDEPSAVNPLHPRTASTAAVAVERKKPAAPAAPAPAAAAAAKAAPPPQMINNADANAKAAAATRPAAAATAAAKRKTDTQNASVDADEPEPRRPNNHHQQQQAVTPASTPDRASSNAPFGDTPSVVHRPNAYGTSSNGGGGGGGIVNYRDPNNTTTNAGGSTPASAPVAVVGHSKLITKRNPSRSPSRDPYGHPTLLEEVRAASAAYPEPANNSTTNAASGASPNTEDMQDAIRSLFPTTAPVATTTTSLNTSNKSAKRRAPQLTAAAKQKPVRAAAAAVPALAARRGGAAGSGNTIDNNTMNAGQRRLSDSGSAAAAAAAAAIAAPPHRVPVVSAPPPDSDSDDDYLRQRGPHQHHNHTNSNAAAAAAASAGRAPPRSAAAAAAINSNNQSGSSLDLVGFAARPASPRSNNHHRDNDTNSNSNGVLCSLTDASLSDGTAAGGRPTVAAIPGDYGSDFYGHKRGNGGGGGGGSSAGGSLSSLPRHNGNGNDDNSDGMTPQAGDISGAATPPPPTGGGGGTAAPFYSQSWEEVNLTK